MTPTHWNGLQLAGSDLQLAGSDLQLAFSVLLFNTSISAKCYQLGVNNCTQLLTGSHLTGELAVYQVE